MKEIKSIKILGYDDDDKEHDLTNVISDETDSSLSQDIEDFHDD